MFNMRRREFITLLGGAAASSPLAVRAQQTERVRRIGVLMAVAESDPDVHLSLAAFQQSLHGRGWSEGRNLRLEYRWGAADASRIRTFARELVDLSPDIILAYATPSVVALMQETRSIPIVFLSVTDPLGQGLITSLAHPGGNITGFSVFEISLGTKWLEVLKEIAPRMTRATIIFNPETAPYYPLYLRSIEKGAPSFALGLVAVHVHNDVEIGRAISTAGRDPNGGLIVLPDTFNFVHRELIIGLAARHRLPAIYYFRYFPRDGGLMSYGPDEIDNFRRAAGYVDRILKGAKPATLPVQQPTKFELVINLKTAKALGLEVPAKLLATADEVIE
jgi:putative tryptophan/tyrosine transport system substrate-binding protein